MLNRILIIIKGSKFALLGTTGLCCLASATPVMAENFQITSSDGSTNGNIANNAINGSDTVSLEVALTSSGVGIKTTNSGANDGNTITVSEIGSINTNGINAYGIYNVGDDNTTTVSGGINAASINAYGIYNVGDDNTTTVSGSIETNGTGALGIRNKGNDNTTTVSGSIETADTDSYGIFDEGNNNTTTVSGSIKTTANLAYGIVASGNDNTTTVSGSIETAGNSTVSIVNHGANNVTTVSGSMKTTGAGASNIWNWGNNNEVTVSGTIETAGTGAHGIYNQGDNNTTTVSGTVQTTGATSTAFYNWSGSGSSLTLNEGATIIGDILADVDSTNSKLTFNLGASSSYAYSVSGKGEGTGAGQWTFSDLDGRSQGITTNGTGCDTTITGAGNTVCNLVTGVSTGNLEVQDELQFSMNSSMISSLSLGRSNSAIPVEAMSAARTSRSSTWFNTYGDTSDRSASATKLAFDGSNRGSTIGTPLAINDTLNLDLVFNSSNANLDIGSAKEQKITAQSYNIGAVLRDLAPSTGWTVDAFGFVGRNSYDGTRMVMNNQEATGSETVTAAYSGIEVLVGLGGQYNNPINDTLNFIGGLNANLSSEYIGAYSESKYFSWDARMMTQASRGITAGLEHSKDALTTFASLGLQDSSLLNGETVTYGTAGHFNDSSKGSTYSSITVGFNYASSESMTISGAVEAFSSTGSVRGSSASLTASWSF